MIPALWEEIIAEYGVEVTLIPRALFSLYESELADAARYAHKKLTDAKLPSLMFRGAVLVPFGL
jgi:hypothetical protein